MKQKGNKAELETTKSSVLAPKVERPKIYFNLVVRYDKYLQYFLERFLILQLSIAAFSFNRINQMSAEINILFNVVRFIKRCDALNFQLFIKSFFDYLGCRKLPNTFFLIFWRLIILDIFKYLLKGLSIQCIIVYFFDFGDKLNVL